MKKLILICFVLLTFISLVYGLCEEGQIDINSASAIELDDIKWVGLPVAEDIISKRPFNSLDELVNVNYITESRVEDIKNQGLACVENEYEEPENETNEEEEIIEDDAGKEDLLNKSVEDAMGGLGEKTQTITPEVISLTPKDIKSEDNIESLDKTDYAKYGFIGFCILIGVLLILKNKRKQKNEII